MKKLLATLFILLVLLQLCILPASAIVTGNGDICPSVATLPATSIADSSATLNGSVTITPVVRSIVKPEGVVLVSLQYARNGEPQVLVSFQYGTVPGVYTNTTPEITIPFTVNTIPFQASISGLSACTTYYARARFHILSEGCDNTIFDQYGDRLIGAGVGLDYKSLQIFFIDCDPIDYYCNGNEISFQTTGCQTYIGTGSHGNSVGGATGTVSTTYGFNPPVTNPTITTQSASLSAKSVAPGTPVTVTADITNSSPVNGSKKITLYVNGQVESTQGITVSSGGSTKLTFNVTRSEPGDYSVYVDGVPAGSFKVELFRESDAILVFSVVLVALAFIAGMFMLWRRQKRAG